MKNSHSQTKFTGSYKKKSVIVNKDKIVNQRRPWMVWKS